MKLKPGNAAQSLAVLAGTTCPEIHLIGYPVKEVDPAYIQKRVIDSF
jgi:hypothetical protein